MSIIDRKEARSLPGAGVFREAAALIHKVNGWAASANPWWRTKMNKRWRKIAAGVANVVLVLVCILLPVACKGPVDGTADESPARFRD